MDALAGLYVFESQYQFETLLSEKLRVTILSGCFIMASLWILATNAAPGIEFPVKGFYMGVPVAHCVAGAYAVFALYEFSAGRLFSFFIRIRRQVPARALYFNALVETGIPTIMLLLFSSVIGINSLSAPVIWTYFLFIILSALRLDFKLCLVTGAWSAAGYLAASLHILSAFGSGEPGASLINHSATHVSRAAALVMGGVAAGFVAWQIKKRIMNSLEQVEEIIRIKDTFGRHVSPQVAQQLLNNPGDAGGQLKTVTIMFLDVRRFTSFADAHTPGKVVDYLNSMLDFMIKIINDNNGLINKFLGDGFMAVFGAPFSDESHSLNAVNAAMEIVDEVDKRVGSGRLTPTRIGIGLHAGEVVTGNIGSSARKEYTVIGGTVNLASRIESLNKEYDSSILVSDAVWKSVMHDLKELRRLGPLKIRGVAEPIILHQIA